MGDVEDDMDQLEDGSRRFETRQIYHVFEAGSISVRRPFIVFVLIEIMENRWRGS